MSGYCEAIDHAANRHQGGLFCGVTVIPTPHPKYGRRSHPMKTMTWAIILTAVLLLPSHSFSETDDTAALKILPHGATFTKGTTSCSYFLKNTSTHTLSGPFRVVMEAMNNASVSLTNPDGYTSEGKPYLLYPEQSLAPKAKTTDRTWVFSHQCAKKAVVTLSPYVPSAQLPSRSSVPVR